MSGIAADIARQVSDFSTRTNRCDRPVIAIAMARDEADIIERFVRHALSWADSLLVVDHASCDGTSLILQRLVEEGLPLCVIRDDAIGKHQSDRMTLLARSAVEHLNAHIIVPLDADEFLVGEKGKSPRPKLMELSPDAVTCAHWRSYVPTPRDDASELDVLKRIGWRLAAEPAVITKVIFGGLVAREKSFRLGYGSHWIAMNTEELMPKSPSSFHLCHFPVRSAGQITAKVLLGPLVGMLDRERPGTAQGHYGWLKQTSTIHSYMSASELQSAAEHYGLREKRDPAGLILDPVIDQSGALRYPSGTNVDAAHRIEQFVRRLLIAERDQQPTALRELILDENSSLRAARDQALARLGWLEPEYQRMLSSRSVRFSIGIRRILERLRRPFVPR